MFRDAIAWNLLFSSPPPWDVFSHLPVEKDVEQTWLQDEGEEDVVGKIQERDQQGGLHLFERDTEGRESVHVWSGSGLLSGRIVEVGG